MITLSKTGTVVSPAADVDVLRTRFESQHYLILPNLLESSLLDLVSRRLQSAPFQLRVYEGIGQDLCPEDVQTTSLLNFLCNNQRLLETVAAITGCGRLGSFRGKIYRMNPGADHFDSWHDDVHDNRKIALSINLSEEPYDGGVLEIRDHQSKQVLSRITRTGFGDAVIFRIADYLEHRRTPVTGQFAKTAFAGWFRSQPDFHQQLRDMRVAGQNKKTG